jgi:predicted nucleic acid-binding protein
VIVADASVVIDLLLGRGSPAGDALAAHYQAGEVVGAPHLIDAEVGQGLRRFAMAGDLPHTLATSLIDDFLELPITRYPHRGLLARAFELRANVTVYDGLYLALSEAVQSPLLTGDTALRNIPGCWAAVEVVTTSA